MKKQILFTLLCLFTILVGCDSDDPVVEETTVEQDKGNINNSLDKLVACTKNLESGDFLQAGVDFLGLSEGEVMNEDWADDVFSNLSDVFDFEAIEDARRFDFNFYKGTYSYVPSTKTWTKAANSEAIVWEFPSKPTSTTNNAILKLSSYTDTKANFDNDDYFLPKTLNMNLTVDAKELFRMKVNNVNYESGTFSIPNTFDIEIFTAPVSHVFRVNQKSKTEFFAEFTMETNGDCKEGVELEVKLDNSDYENFNIEDGDVTTAKISVFSGDMRVEFSVNGNLLTIDDPTATQTNANVQANVFMRGQLIGELDYRVENGEDEIYIIYKDGTEENASVYYEDFIEEMEVVFDEFLDE